MRMLKSALPLLLACGLILLVFQESRRFGWFALGSLVLARVAVRLWIPMAAHRAFQRGNARRARLLYGALRFLRLDPGARASLWISLAACAIEREDWIAAESFLSHVDEEALPEEVRAIWLNNRAYALLRSGGPAAEALRLVDEATDLRPRVPGFRHTRGLALIGARRLDEGIRELHTLWDSFSDADISPFLEAERCFDLALAWQASGESEYASDYLRRAVRTAPGSRWAQRAEARLLAFAAPVITEL